MASATPQRETKEGWIRVFSPDTRTLSPAEISSIPFEVRRRTEAGEDGTWLEVQCPEQKCLIGEHKMAITIRGAEPRKKEDLWHKLYCPEDRCYAQSPVDLP